MSLSSLFHRTAIATSLTTAAAIGGLVAAPVLSHAPKPVEHRQIYGTEANSTQLDSIQAIDQLGINREAVLGVAFLGSAAIGMGLTAIQERNRPTRSNSISETKSAANLQSASPKLQQQLLRLLHEDRRAAARLTHQAQIKYPGHSANWYIEKVIYDLERDRGRV